MQLDETFTIIDRVMVRSVVPKRGTPYQHTCELAVYENVAHTIDELDRAGFTLDDLQARTQAPHSQVAVALAFLKERGCIVPSVRRKHVAASGAVHLDAMTEWHALREKAAS